MQLSIAGGTNGNVSMLSHAVQREELIGEIFDRLYGLSNIADRQSLDIEKMTGLSKIQALTIKAVSRAPSAHVSELARSMYLNPANMVRILDRLEEQGLITRTRQKKDRRVVEIGLSEKAKDIESTIRNITHDSMMHCLVGAEDRELINMLNALQRLSSLLDAVYLHPSPLRDADSLKGKL
jgi:MarR family transcriptional regulator, organic hydroperoxide resistance regulator